MFLLLSSQPMYAQQWQLRGRLVEKVDRTTPLDAAEILVSPLGGDVTSSSLSDEEGRFALSLSSGKYVFRYRQLGDILKTDTLDVQADTDWVIFLRNKEIHNEGGYGYLSAQNA